MRAVATTPVLLLLLLYLLLCLFGASRANQPVSTFSYDIGFSWDGKPLQEIGTSVWLRRGKGGLFVDVQGRLYNDPPRPDAPAGPYTFLWLEETVELFLANDDNQYVQIQLGPWGHYSAYLFDGERNKVRSQLELRYVADQDRKTKHWFATAFLPLDYLPPNTTKMNAFSQHGSCTYRKYEALYPANDGALSEPDFHKLQYFQPIRLSVIGVKVPTEMSQVWSDAIGGKTSQSYVIQKTWDGKPVNHQGVKLQLEKGDSGHMVVVVESPFYDEPAPPGARQGEPFFPLWDYEVVEVFFLNDNSQYLEIEFSPHGAHLVLLLNGTRNVVKHSLPMEYASRIFRGTGSWLGVARIPHGYFPPGVSKFNAFVSHGTDEKVYEALYEVSGPGPDFHRLAKFRPIDVERLVPNNEHLSGLWIEALAEQKKKKRKKGEEEEEEED